MVGGVAVVAHHAGTKSAEGKEAEAQQNQQIADLQAQQAPPAAAAPSAGGNDMVTQLENLKKLLDEGVLTQAEFDMQKQKLLSAS
ncbi:MAG: SHOCT domain-containing protein [Thermoleophilia bacterium]|nr:SHOCT domain-containing protein [Thermoleophilia bacterium]